MSVERHCRGFCRRQGFAPQRGQRILCAVSGGADSMCLLHLLAQWGQEEGFAVLAATFDHGIRPESKAETAAVGEWCRQRGIPFFTEAGDVPSYAEAQGCSLEEGARELRYAFLERTAETRRADYIATAHNADDNAENLLLALLRGTGLNGLGGIPPRRGRIIRPLLEITRQEIEEYCRVNRLSYCTDASNKDTAYTRNFIRHRIMPLMKERNPSFVRTAGRTAELLRQDESYLNELTEEAWNRLVTQEDGELSVSAGELAALPEVIGLRLVQKMAEALKPGLILPQNQRQSLLELAAGGHPSAEISLVERLQGRRVYDMLILSPGREKHRPIVPVAVMPGQDIFFPEQGRSLHWKRVTAPERSAPGSLYLRLNPEDRVQVRCRMAGDTLTLPKRPEKRLKTLMIAQKIPRETRDSLLVLELNQRIIAVEGLGSAGAYTPAPGEAAWEITIQ